MKDDRHNQIRLHEKNAFTFGSFDIKPSRQNVPNITHRCEGSNLMVIAETSKKIKSKKLNLQQN